MFLFFHISIFVGFFASLSLCFLSSPSFGFFLDSNFLDSLFLLPSGDFLPLPSSRLFASGSSGRRPESSTLTTFPNSILSFNLSLPVCWIFGSSSTFILCSLDVPLLVSPVDFPSLLRVSLLSSTFL